MATVGVLLSSGDIDTWENVDAAVDMNLGGALVLTAKPDGERGLPVVAIYAPGMWMKVEFE